MPSSEMRQAPHIIHSAAPKVVALDHEREGGGRDCGQKQIGRRQNAQHLPVAPRAEQRQRHRAAHDRHQSVGNAKQQGEDERRRDRRTPRQQRQERQRHDGDGDATDIDRVPFARHRQIPDTAGDLRHALERGDPDSHYRRQPGRLEDRHEMRCHGAKDDGTCRHDHAEQQHGARAGCALQRCRAGTGQRCSRGGRLSRCRNLALRQAEPMQRQTEAEIDGRKYNERAAPTVCRIEAVRDRPEHGGGEAAE
jgi:hypothetical protein